MKILETQSATLTNYEVLTHLQSMTARYATQPAPLSSASTTADSNASKKPTKPKNLTDVMQETQRYLERDSSPLKADLNTTPGYTPSAVKELVQRLKPYDLTKAEVLMIFNLRPGNTDQLDLVVEESEERFDDAQRQEIVTIIGDVLGQVAVEDSEEAVNGVEEG